MKELDHVSQAENIIIQLGISALVVLVLGYVGYKVAVLLINKWAVADNQRTKEIGDGFRSMNDSHASVMRHISDAHAIVMKQVNDNHNHSLAVINAHQQDELELMQSFRVELNRMDAKVSQAMEMTPPPMMIGEIPGAPVDRDTPAERPSLKAPRASTASGIPRPIGEYRQTIPQRPKKG